MTPNYLRDLVIANRAGRRLGRSLLALDLSAMHDPA
jgi:hypothetical protein